MAVLTYPGVYMEEVSSGVKPIETAGTSTAAFFGVAEQGPIGSVKKVFNFTEFQATYGGFMKGYFLAHAVYQFFNNGGSQCYVGRVATGADTAEVTVRDRGAVAQESLTFSAASPGAWGNRIMVVIDSDASDDPLNAFTLTVYRDNDTPDAPAVRLETHEDLSMNPASPQYVQTAVNARSGVLRVLVNEANSNQIPGYSQGGALAAGNPLAAKQRQIAINIHNDGYRTVDFTEALKDVDLTDLPAVAAAMQADLRALVPLRDSTPKDAYEVTVTVEQTDRLRITSGNTGADSRVEIIDGPDPLTNAASALKLGTRNGGIEVEGSSTMRPLNTAPDTPYLLGDDTVSGAVSAIQPGTDGTLPLNSMDYINALHWLDAIRDVSLIAIPGIGTTDVADAGMAYCRNRPLSDCFYIADMDIATTTLEGALAYRNAINTPNSYGAVYFPWLKTLDPTGLSPEPIAVPPSGYVAGIYSRTDAKRGVWKAPAGTEAMLSGAVGLAADLTDPQHGNLNKHKKSVCVIRKFPGSGIVLWGARTLSSDAEYRYIPVRRMAMMLRVSIYNGIQWTVFEPNDEELWSQIRLNIGSFMMTLFRQGAFQGATPSKAFFVKCDGETTTQADIDRGVVNVLVGFAPLKPAEFVVVKLSQAAGQR
ncbi:phage tail sheath subtilisin-like domain-containing protein [Desulfoluna spongiiphila]|uniref:phage tail sheath subtilisin-like domain-containing protein n=1 Tax=Desulfoluna spongiiphila TaxID=419481 RepID=UPI0012597CD1|nr:phage tail sheath subtilisin-like domain-containing protein [Desulfoluna spongiiphila]VVS94498.1 tail sheath protein subtilisin-like domain [Desulfoluna spongiiphila]